MNEIHIELLRRVQTEFSISFTDGQKPLHNLKLADDIITSNGNDTVVGDSATLYFQIDSIADGFQFETVPAKDVDAKTLTDIMTTRQDELDSHVEFVLLASLPLSNSEQSALAFWDVPYFLSVGNDNFDLREL